jgi:hypothetical protein
MPKSRSRPQSPRGGLIAELKRRKVIRVAWVYAVVALVLMQVTQLAVPALLLPDWTLRLVAVLLILGFAIALVLAWAFDMTPAGVQRTPPVARAGGTSPVRRAPLFGGIALVTLAAPGFAAWYQRPAADAGARSLAV